MINEELIINGKRLNLGANLGIRLNRQLLNPSELNTKDAQFSYTISFPTGGVNDEAFNYSSIEETQNKFNRVYEASYSANGVQVFKGMFKLTSVTAGAYKGNLYVPAPKTIKDIFGDLKLNQNPELRIPFVDFAEYVNLYNTAAATEPQYAIFPYTLYGVLPKSPLNRNANDYSARTVWDASVRLSIQDLPPSINPLLMLKHIFTAQGYNLQGTAFDDSRLTRLYLSYKNAADYVQPWNYGQFAKMHVRGGWSSRYNQRTGAEQLERGVSQGSDSTGGVYACDLFDATNTSLEIVQDTGGNILYNEVNDNDGRTFIQAQISIPTSGFYKVRFNASLHVSDAENWRVTDPATGVQHIGGRTSNAVNDFNDNIYEIRLCRDRKSADFGLNAPRLNGMFNYNNQPQNATFDADNIPKYFPQALANGQTNFVDIAQDSAHLLGFNFGRHAPSGQIINGVPTLIPANPDFYNPKAGFDPYAQILVAKPAVSWDASENAEDVTRLAVKSAGFWKYGRIGTFDSEGDNPDIDIDYSEGTKVTGKILDANGNPTNPASVPTGDPSVGYALSATTGFMAVADGFKVTPFIEMAGFTDLSFTLDIDGTADIAVIAYYDINLQFIGAGIIADGESSYVDQPIAAPVEAAYFRLTADEDSEIGIGAANVNNSNVILQRFQLQRFYTYRIETPLASGYQGYAYLHNGAEVGYLQRIEFVNGVAEFNTAFTPIATVDPKLTVYLKTPDFNVDGTLTISRRIQGDSQEVVDWELTDKYKIDLNNAPANYAKCGQYNGAAANADWYAQGEAAAVVWLEAGELLTVATVSSEGRYRRDGMHSTYGWASHEIKYDLDVQPFRTDADWLKVSLQGNGTAAMNWNDAPNFDTDTINLVGFLNTDMKTDEFIDNFCRAFNLRLSQVDITTYSLDIKQSKTAVSSRYVNLDSIASVKDRENTPLGLPSIYKLGFTVDVEEQGYVETQDNGGGEYSTGVVEDSVVEQKSSFSYNWFKNITVQDAEVLPPIDTPPVEEPPVYVPPAPVDTLNTAGLSFGLMTKRTTLDSAVKVAALKKHARSIVLENDFKTPDKLYTDDNTHNWDDVLPQMQFAKDNGLRVHVHTGWWPSKMPTRIKAFFNDPATTVAQAEAQFKFMIQAPLLYFKGHPLYDGVIETYDVYNEPWLEAKDIVNGAEWKANALTTKLGTGVYKRAIKYAKEADPRVLILVNEYGFEYGWRKVDKMVAFAKSCIADGTPLDGFGLQLHNQASVNMNGIKENLVKLAATGLKLRLSEVALSMLYKDTTDAPFVFTPQVEAEQAERYRQLANAWLTGVPAPQRLDFVTWGITDADYMGPAVSEYAMLFNNAGLPKLAMQSMIDQTVALNSLPVQTLAAAPQTAAVQQVAALAADVVIPLAVISKADVWNEAMPYPEAMKKRYTDLAYRFWYYDGLQSAAFKFNGAQLKVARVANSIPNVSVLNYKNAPHTILDNYFTVLINGSSHYTELEGFLTPQMYRQLDGSIMAMFNGDLYYVAELGGYDPTGKNKTTIKLIRKI